MKLLHSADWHLDAPLQGHSETRTAQLQEALLRLPYQVVEAARAQQCQLSSWRAIFLTGLPPRRASGP